MRELATFKVQCAAIHGEARAEFAFRLALLSVARGALESAVRRRERAARLFLAAWEAEDERAWLIRPPRKPGERSWGRRPPWEASTWSAQAELASATADEVFWFDRVGELLQSAGSSYVATVPRHVVIYGDDGTPHTLFPKTSTVPDTSGRR